MCILYFATLTERLQSAEELIDKLTKGYEELVTCVSEQAATQDEQKQEMETMRAELAGVAKQASAAKTKAARAKRLRSVDMSWSLKLGCGAARGCAAMMEKHGGGFPLERLAMRKANIKDPGAMSLAGAIRRSAEAVSNKEKAERSKEWSGHREGVCPYESPYGDREPVCELRWLDLGSNHINDPGAVALGDALGPKVPITRLNLRDNQVGIQGCRSCLLYTSPSPRDS